MFTLKQCLIMVPMQVGLVTWLDVLNTPKIPYSDLCFCEEEYAIFD